MLEAKLFVLKIDHEFNKINSKVLSETWKRDGVDMFLMDLYLKKSSSMRTTVMSPVLFLYAIGLFEYCEKANVVIKENLIFKYKRRK